MPKLLVSLPSGEATHELGEDVVTVGRLPDNSLQIDDASVSSHHAQLTLNGTDYVLQDLGSTNGTLVNGQPVRRVALTDGTNVTLGRTSLVFRQDTGYRQDAGYRQDTAY